jgi:hypothetical protein
MMSRLKHILIMVMALSVMVGGIPTFASACPMATMMDTQAVQDCSQCSKSAGHEKQADSCCKNMACNVHCTSTPLLSHTALSDKAFSPSNTVKLAMLAVTFPSSLSLNTQERPPRIFS